MLYIELIELLGFSYAASPAARSSQSPEAFNRRCSVKKVFLGISQNSQEKVCARESFLTATLLKKSLWHWREFCRISKNTFFYRTPPVAASQSQMICTIVFLKILSKIFMLKL